MDKNTIWKWLILVALLAGSLAVVWPPLPVEDADGNVIHPGKIRLGLDLKGGTSFAVKIDEKAVRREIKERGQDLTDAQVDAEVAKVLDDAQDRALEVMRNRIDNLGISEPIIYPGKDNRIIIQLPGIDEKKRIEAEESIKSVAFLEFRIVHENNDRLVDSLFSKNLAPEGYKIVQSGNRPVYVKDANFSDANRDLAHKAAMGRFHAPSGYEFLLEKGERDGLEIFSPHFVKLRRELSGDYLKTANVDYKQLGQPVVQIEFDGKGSKMFARVTADYAPGGAKNPDPNKYRQLAIVLDNTLYSAPVIREAIFGGNAEISGNFSVPEANFLRNVLRAGSLPAPVEIVEKRFVAPALGSDAIRSGVRAILYGGISVVGFMLVYYMVSGLVANVALFLNMVLLPLGMILAAGVLGIFAKDASGGGGAIVLPVLTLPGIAGILLTIGMAVDANVLIFERIREEFKAGKRLWVAITAGYDRAFVTILDANLTTMLTGIILFVFGSGPIRGFAVTLCAGIMASMFTSLVVTKLLFQLLATYTPIKTLKMMSIIGKTSIDFVSKRRVAATLSVAVILVSWGIMVSRGVSNPSSIFGVDFLGGASVTFKYESGQKVDVETIRNSLADAGVAESHIQYQSEIEAGGDEFLQIKTGSESIDGKQLTQIVKETLQTQFPASAFTVWQEDEVGTQVGKELKTRAFWSIVLALIGIIIYISIRFEFGFALGAIVALTHDVLVTVGIYTLCGRQMSLPVVAALLTIVGYSVNDTIVVFDRIREDLKLMRMEGFKGICNLSINQTLSRTLLTSLTTLLAVVMLLVFGGGSINDFALALFIGVLVGTYSSIFVATPVVLLWHRDKRPEFSK